VFWPMSEKPPAKKFRDWSNLVAWRRFWQNQGRRFGAASCHERHAK